MERVGWDRRSAVPPHPFWIVPGGAALRLSHPTVCPRQQRIMHRSFTPNFGPGVLTRNRVRASTHPANRGKNELCTAGFRQISEKSAAYHMAPKSNARLKLRKLAGRPFSFLRRPPQRTISMSTILPLTPQALKCRPRTGRIMPFDGGRAHKSGRGMKRVSALFAGRHSNRRTITAAAWPWGVTFRLMKLPPGRPLPLRTAATGHSGSAVV